jgi:hypothetical protein
MSDIHEPLQNDIRRLHAVRMETRIWSIGSCIAIVAILVVGMGVVANSANRLLNPGAAQSEFSSDLGTDLNGNVTPVVQAIAGQALTASQPAIQAEFIKLGTRVPDVSHAFMEQFALLQKELPEQGDTIVDASFGKVLDDQQSKIEAMYPGVTDAAVASMIDTITTEAQGQVLAANGTLFGQHEAVLNGITQDINTIRSTEAIGSDPDKANLDMAISVIEAFHSDLSAMDGAAAPTAKGVTKS